MEHDKNCDYLETVKGVHKTLPDEYKPKYKVLRQRNDVIVVQKYCPICNVEIGPKTIVRNDNPWIYAALETGSLKY